jgi:hypothetical protein
MLLQFVALSLSNSTSIYIISFVLLNSAHSAVVIFTKDLIEQSIDLFPHFGTTFILSVVTSAMLKYSFALSSSFASCSALLFHLFLLYAFTFLRVKVMFFASQHSLICLIRLQFLVLNKFQILSTDLKF